MPIHRRRIFVSVSSLLLMLLGLLAAGCQEASPPPITTEALAEAKKEREVIMRKEYGNGGFKQTRAKR